MTRLYDYLFIYSSFENVLNCIAAIDFASVRFVIQVAFSFTNFYSEFTQNNKLFLTVQVKGSLNDKSKELEDLQRALGDSESSSQTVMHQKDQQLNDVKFQVEKVSHCSLK